MTTFLELLCFVLFILLIVGLFKPSLVLRWTKKPTRLKVFGYWALSFIVLAITLAIVDIPIHPKLAPQEDTEIEFNYGIITQKTGSKVMIDAYYDSDTYEKKVIESVLVNMTDSLKNIHPNKTVGIYLYPSKRIGIADRTQWIALYSFNKNDNSTEIIYGDQKINALNSRYTDKDFLELEKFLNDKNTSTYDIYTEMQEIAKNALKLSDIKYGKYNYPNERMDFEENTERKGMDELFKKYNIPDSLDYKISAYSIYCK